MKLVAFSQMTEECNCKFFDSNNSLAYYSLQEKSGINCKVNVFNANNDLISCITCNDSKELKRNTYVIEKSNQKFVFSFDHSGDLVCEEHGLKLKNVFLDKWFKLTKNEKCFCSVRSFTFVKDWLSAKYTVELINVDEIDLCVSLCIVKFMSIYEAAIFSTTHYFGKI